MSHAPPHTARSLAGSHRRAGVRRLITVILALLAITAPALAQPADSGTNDTNEPESATTSDAPAVPRVQIDNPVGLVEDAADSVSGFEGGISSALNVLILLTVLTLAPSILILCTSFTRIIIVLALLRQAMGTQTLPPTQVLIGLALFMTFLIMAPTFEQMNETAFEPLSNGEIGQVEAWARAKQPLRDFMFNQIEHTDNWSDVYMILNYRGIDTSQPSQLQRRDVDMLTLVPAYILSELKTAFLIGFRIYLPFLIIDMVVASLLISMGMLMLPPVLISLPFKLLLFVLVDGWRLVVGNMLDSFIIVSSAAT